MKKKYFDILKPVFWPSAILILLFIVITLSVGQPMEIAFVNLQKGISENAGWVFILSVNIFLAYVLYLAISKFGDIRLGGKKAKPEFTRSAWFAMLFSAGMGIGLLFWSVAEPVSHYLNPPSGEGGTIQSARNALGLTFLHWGLHTWAIYALVGAALAFFTFNRKLPLTIRSLFYPALGDRIHKTPGHVIDVLAVTATLFGLATSLGFGVRQINAGLNHLFGIPDNVYIQVFLIIVITLAATFSVVSGLQKGIRFLSQWNVRLALVLLIFLLAVGPTLFILKSFIQNTGYYLQNLVRLGFWTESYQQTNWQNDWTVFYWAWWISWSPFVGMFIARISKGRTLREFVLGVLFVPAIVTFLWLSTFGGSAIFLELEGLANIAGAVQKNVSTALFVLFENFPLSWITSLLGIVLVTTFFVTSSDSGSLVIDSITAGGKLDAPVGQRIFWSICEGAVAAALLIGGGLTALQTAAITTGLPFTLLLLLACYSFQKGIKEEYRRNLEEEKNQEREFFKKTITKLINQQREVKEGKDAS